VRNRTSRLRIGITVFLALAAIACVALAVRIGLSMHAQANAPAAKYCNPSAALAWGRQSGGLVLVQGFTPRAQSDGIQSYLIRTAGTNGFKVTGGQNGSDITIKAITYGTTLKTVCTTTDGETWVKQPLAKGAGLTTVPAQSGSNVQILVIGWNSDSGLAVFFLIMFGICLGVASAIAFAVRNGNPSVSLIRAG
jgi:hypothetical protein